VDCIGAPDGLPVFLLHGTPGSRRGPRPRPGVLYRLGIRLICYDRPGYGGSDRCPGRSVADAATDVATIADALHVDSFSVVGRSGGAPHALACAALLGERVESAAALVGLAPPDAPGLDWYDGMTKSNTTEYGRADTDPGGIAEILAERGKLICDDPELLLRELRPELTPADRRIVDEVAIQRLLTDTYHEALKHGAHGWIDDTLALRGAWKFELSAITSPVLIWHGLDDVFSPVSHARWLADHIRANRDDAPVQVVLKRHAAHFDAMEVLPDILVWIRRVRGSERLGVQRPHQLASAAERSDRGMPFTEQPGELVDRRGTVRGRRVVAELFPGEQQVGAAAQGIRVPGPQDAG
jgi:pimeloyl-ACP methyl ester carboxylesterase